jgi:superfamily II DNA helicase RecQ
VCACFTISAEDSTACGNCDTCLDPPVSFDGTVAAQQLLSCIYRTGQRFGAMHVIDVLRGERNDKVAQWDHDQLSTFGIGRDRSGRNGGPSSASASRSGCSWSITTATARSSSPRPAARC